MKAPSFGLSTRPSGHTYVMMFRGEEFKPECLNLTAKITVWSCVATSGVRCLYIVHGTINSTKYIGTLQKCMVS